MTVIKDPGSIPVKKRRPTIEHDEQLALFAWASVMESRHPQLKWLFAIPNGGHRHKRVAVKLKAEGVKAGVSDIFLPVPVEWSDLYDPSAKDQYHGLWIEMKYGKNKLSSIQKEFQRDMEAEGYKVAVCWKFEEARDAIIEYLGLEVKP